MKTDKPNIDQETISENAAADEGAVIGNTSSRSILITEPIILTPFARKLDTSSI
jgi:hypothetical protein